MGPFRHNACLSCARVMLHAILELLHQLLPAACQPQIILRCIDCFCTCQTQIILCMQRNYIIPIADHLVHHICRPAANYTALPRVVLYLSTHIVLYCSTYYIPNQCATDHTRSLRRLFVSTHHTVQPPMVLYLPTHIILCCSASCNHATDHNRSGRRHLPRTHYTVRQKLVSFL